MSPSTFIWIFVGVFCFLLAVLTPIAIYAQHKKNAKETSDVWEKRNVKRKEPIHRFNTDCSEKGFHSDKIVDIKAYYHTENLVNICSLRVDLTGKMLAACSFEADEYKPLFLKFEDIESFEVLDGIVSSTSESYADGASFHGLAAGSSDTYVTNEVENLRLKLETKDLCNPVSILCLFRYRVDVTSDVYKRLLDSVEEIKTLLNRIVKDNAKKE